MLLSLDTPRRMPAEVDLTLLWSSLILLLIGMVMVYSASIAIAEAGHFTGNHSAYFLIRHGVFLGSGWSRPHLFSRCRYRPGSKSLPGCSSLALCCWRWC